MEKVTKTRKNVRNKIGLKGARSFSSFKRLKFSLRGYDIDHLNYIVAMHGKRFVPVFQELGLEPWELSTLQTKAFRTA